MRPLWIINLGQEATSAEHLQKLFSELTDDHRAHWHYTAVKQRPVPGMSECNTLMEFLVSEGRACNNDFIKAGAALVDNANDLVLMMQGKPHFQGNFYK